MMIKIKEYAKDNNSEDYKPLEHVTQHDEYYRNDQQHYPANMNRDQFIIGFVNVV